MARPGFSETKPGARFSKVPVTFWPVINYSKYNIKNESAGPQAVSNKQIHLGLLTDIFIILSTKLLKPRTRM